MIPSQAINSQNESMSSSSNQQQQQQQQQQQGEGRGGRGNHRHRRSQRRQASPATATTSHNSTTTTTTSASTTSTTVPSNNEKGGMIDSNNDNVNVVPMNVASVENAVVNTNADVGGATNNNNNNENTNSNGGVTDTRPKNRQRRQRQRNNKNNKSTKSNHQDSTSANNINNNNNEENESNQDKNNVEQPSKTNNLSNTNTKNNTNSNNTNDQSKNKKKKSKKPKKKKKYPWRKFVPQGCIDPISLEPIVSLPYPPFALRISEPYVPISSWPPPPAPATNSTTTITTASTGGAAAAATSSNKSSKKNKKGVKNDTTNNNEKELIQEKMKQRQNDALEQQWGNMLLSKVNNNSNNNTTNNSISTHDNPSSTTTQEKSEYELNLKHVHLFDGHSLAIYLTSQRQFIDPLNRRDLTRNELLQLDLYLQRHGLTEGEVKGSMLRVVDAYDELGISISSAGVNGQSSTGRQLILEQSARNVLNAIIGEGGSGNNGGGGGGGSGGTASSSERGSNTTPSRNVTHTPSDPSATATPSQQTMNAYAMQSSMFNTHDDTHNRIATSINHRQHQSHSTHHHQHHHSNHPSNMMNDTIPEDGGIYAQEGFMVIDDDMTPGLRGGVPTANTAAAAAAYPSLSDNASGNPNTVSSTPSTIPTWMPGYNQGMAQEDYFPELSTSATATNTNTTTSSSATDASSQPDNATATTTKNNNNNPRNNTGTRSKTLSRSKTLAQIGKLVQKTDPKKLKKQTKAREKFIQKMEMSRMAAASSYTPMSTTTTSSSSSSITMDGFARPTAMDEDNTVSDIILERNRNLASALGVKPAKNYMTGWARPTNTSSSSRAAASLSNKGDLDEFGNELITQYPDSLIIEARERMSGVLLKLEKKWKTFLEDDKAASCPLKAMDRSTRKFVHEYSDFWKLHTESFDPEPRRYIHCVKLKETSAPYPLLSDAAIAWRGPTITTAATTNTLSADGQKKKESIATTSTEQSAGEVTMSGTREFPQTEERIPLQLMPKSSAVPLVVPEGAMFEIDSLHPSTITTDAAADMTTSTACPLTLSTAAKAPASSNQTPAPRFAPLLEGRDEQRIKLKLDPRTLPLDADHTNAVMSHDTMEEAMEQYDFKVRKAQANKIRMEERKQRILEDAFASSDDSDANDCSSDESDWEIGEALYSGDDDEEED